MPFSAAAAQVLVGGAYLPVPYFFGWLRLDLRPWTAEPADPYAQAWVGLARPDLPGAEQRGELR